MKRTLIIVPHTDDETFGLSGYIQRFQHTEKIHIIIVSSGNDIDNSQIRIDQCNKILYKYNVTFEYFNEAFSCKLMQSRDIISFLIEGRIKTFKPNLVMMPNCNDLHQDHKLVNELCKIASKPNRHSYINEILEYCVPESEVFSVTYFDTVLHLTDNEHNQKLADADTYSTEYIPDLPKYEMFKTIYRRL